MEALLDVLSWVSILGGVFFMVVGSIGVVATIPNVHRLLKKYDVDVELITAGQ